MTTASFLVMHVAIPAQKVTPWAKNIRDSIFRNMQIRGYQEGMSYHLSEKMLPIPIRGSNFGFVIHSPSYNPAASLAVDYRDLSDTYGEVIEMSYGVIARHVKSES